MMMMAVMTLIHNVHGHSVWELGNKETHSTDFRPTSEVWTYNQTLELWQKQPCSALRRERRRRLGQLYLFGGYSEEGNQNSLHKLNLRDFTWSSVQPCGGQPPLACDKSVCWQYDDRLYLFAGYGRGCDPAQWRADPGYEFILDHSSPWHYPRGWNNQLVCYDPASNQWQWPETTGDVPIPRAAHAAACLGSRVFVFGGRNGGKRMNDMYVLDMRTMVWTQIMENNEHHAVSGRSWHSLTALSDSVLLLYGGLSTDSRRCTTAGSSTATPSPGRRFSCPSTGPASGTAPSARPSGKVSVLICGGATENLALLSNNPDSRIYARETFSIELQPKSLYRLCLGAVSRHEATLRPKWYDLPHNLQEVLSLRSRSTLPVQY
ncbi:Kelch domain-containing protein 2 [Tyrophagus putrescentiae]|nr:Kelch domain-containing protein 2 [Tyrophagus putrescentiae]